MALPYQDFGPVIVRVGSIGGVANSAKRLGRLGEHKQSIRPASSSKPMYGHVVQHMGWPLRSPSSSKMRSAVSPCSPPLGSPDATSTACSTRCA